MLKLKKVFATVLSIGLGITSIPITSLDTFAEESKIYTYDDYSVEYIVTNSWGNTDAVDVEITNNGDKTIENWMLYFDPNGEIAHIWNAKEATSPSGYTYFKNSGYNSAISVGAQVKFSYFVEDCTGFPSDFIMCQKRAEKETGYSVSVTERESWGNRFNGTISLSNDSDTAIEDWELTFDTNFTITEITSSWAGTMTTLEPYSYKLKGSYTNVIAPHTSMALGFSGVKNGTPEIISSTLTEVVVNEELFSIHNVLQNDCIDWSELPDSDGDGLPDEYESNYGCNANIADTDGDGLPDGYEIMKIGSDPSDSHSLDTIITDGAYDNDSDGVSNLDEYSLGTNPLVVDSDYDDLTDGQEVNDYHTDPLDDDTDDDGISDGDEISLGLNPLLTDTDNDGVPDNKETFEQSVSFDGAESDDLVEQISVSFNGTGYINSTTKIESIMDTDWMCSNIVGLIGEPYDITTSSEFENATITFNVDTSSVTESDFDDLIVLWYDEENQRFVNMDAMLDYDTHSLSFTTSHFSKYMIVNKRQWYNAWSENNYPNNGNTLHTAITIDCSGSTQITDPSCYRVTAANSFVDVMKEADLASVIFFGTSAFIEQGLTNDKDALHDAINRIPELATTNYEAAIQQAMNSLSVGQSNSSEDIIIFLSDGAPTEDIDGKGTPISPERFDYSIIDDAANAGIKIYTIGLSTPPGSNGETILKEIANRTNGEYYYATTADELVAHFLTINMSKNYDITTDTDKDGLPDLFETCGMPLANGGVIFTDPNNPDSDEDGLKDGEEINMHIFNSEKDVADFYKYMYSYVPDDYISDNGGIYFEFKSNPTKKDSDNDGIIDGNEVVNITTDSRYDNLNPLVQDTIETLFPEINEKSKSKTDERFKVTIEKNNIKIQPNIVFKGDYDQKASVYLKTNEGRFTQSIISQLGSDCSLKDLFLDGIKNRWSGEYKGTVYDFYPGLKITSSIKKIDSDINKPHIEVTIHAGKCGVSNTRVNANLNNITYINMYTSYCKDQSHKDTINSNCESYKANHYDHTYFEGTCAHEFGHTLNLDDAYADQNNGYEPVSDSSGDGEIYYAGFGCPGAGEIMMNNGNAIANDIEMVLYGYYYNRQQYFVPSLYRDISDVIKSPQKYINSENHKVYIWDKERSEFVEV